MDAVTMEFLSLGFELSSRTLSFIHAQGSPEAAVAVLEPSATRLAEALRTMPRRNGSGPESTTVEELRVRARDLAMLARMKRPQDAPRYLEPLVAAVAAARAHLEEGQALWLGPWLAGRAVAMAAAFYAGAASPSDVAAFEEEVETSRARLLESVRSHLLASSDVPWRELAAFVRGEGTQLLPWLLGAGADMGAMRTLAPRVERPKRPLSLDEVVARAEDLLKKGLSVYVTPLIPEKKVRGARGSFLEEAQPDEPLVALIDTTVFGGAEHGVAFLGERFFFKDLTQDMVWLPYSDVVTARAEGDHVIVETPLKAASSDLSPSGRFGSVLKMNLLESDRALRVAGFLQAVRHI